VSYTDPHRYTVPSCIHTGQLIPGITITTTLHMTGWNDPSRG